MSAATPIHIRDPELDFEEAIPRDWLAGNTLATHIFNGLNLVFPDGERFFIQAVRDCADDSLSPQLQRDIRLFNGQEGRHAHEHERYFRILENQGYKVSGFLRFFHNYIKHSSRWMPASLRLSMTAGAEHYTATFGAFCLEDPLIDDAHPTMRKLVLWHSTEEIEHKHVAYDVLQAKHPSLWLRRLGLVAASFDLFGLSWLATRMLLRQDFKAGRIDRAQLRAEKAALRERDEAIGALVRERVRAYWRADFHPSQTDERPAAYAKLEELGIRVA